MLHIYVQKFDVTDSIENFLETKQGQSHPAGRPPAKPASAAPAFVAPLTQAAVTYGLRAEGDADDGRRPAGCPAAYRRLS